MDQSLSQKQNNFDSQAKKKIQKISKNTPSKGGVGYLEG